MPCAGWAGEKQLKGRSTRPKGKERHLTPVPPIQEKKGSFSFSPTKFGNGRTICTFSAKFPSFSCSMADQVCFSCAREGKGGGGKKSSLPPISSHSKWRHQSNSESLIGGSFSFGRRRFGSVFLRAEFQAKRGHFFFFL